jgi:hypothetical protein
MERFGISLSVPTGRRHGSCCIPEDIWDELSRSPIPASAEVVNASEGLKRIASKLGVAADSDAVLHAIEAIEDACLAERNRNQDLMESQNAMEVGARQAEEMNVEYEQEIMDFETIMGASCERSCVRGEYEAMQALREIRSAFDLQSKEGTEKEAENQRLRERNESLLRDIRRLREWNESQVRELEQSHAQRR